MSAPDNVPEDLPDLQPGGTGKYYCLGCSTRYDLTNEPGHANTIDEVVAQQPRYCPFCGGEFVEEA